MAAETTPEKTRDEEIYLIWTANQWLYIVVGFLAGVLFFPLLQLVTTDASNLLSNLVPEAVGIGFTVLFIDQLNRRRDERNAERALKEQLVRDAGSTSNEVAKNAVHQLRKIKQGEWLIGENGLLKAADLTEANLFQANLSQANLEDSRLVKIDLRRANLSWANMRRTDIRMGNLYEANLGWTEMPEASLAGCNLEKAMMAAVNLSRACLQGTNLERAELYGANLEQADLRFAIVNDAQLEGANLQSSLLSMSKFQGANLRGARLQGANLVVAVMRNVDLRGAKLQGAIIKNEAGETLFDETTILPDGTNWSSGRDMRQFTHPDEWAREHPAPE